MCDGISLMMKCVFMMLSHNYKRDDLIKKKDINFKFKVTCTCNH